MAGCTFVFSMNAGKSTQQALDIADSLFTSMMRGNKLRVEAIFIPDETALPAIRSEAIERVQLCTAQTKSEVASMLKELWPTYEGPPAELIKLATQDFQYFWMRSLEDIRQGR